MVFTGLQWKDTSSSGNRTHARGAAAMIVLKGGDFSVNEKLVAENGSNE
jgi:hypothetical protein